jgi:hypothetical protein
MQFKLEIRMDNAAFKEDSGSEVSAILWKLSSLVDCSYLSEEDGGNLYDINGNAVGSWGVTS